MVNIYIYIYINGTQKQIEFCYEMKNVRKVKLVTLSVGGTNTKEPDHNGLNFRTLKSHNVEGLWLKQAHNSTQKIFDFNHIKLHFSCFFP